jgi:hypothetical protein
MLPYALDYGCTPQWEFIMMSQIINNLWLGSQYDADHINPDFDSITAILNVRGPDCHTPPGRD